MVALHNTARSIVQSMAKEKLGKELNLYFFANIMTKLEDLEVFRKG